MKQIRQPLVLPDQKMPAIWNLLLFVPLLMMIYLFPVKEIMEGSFSVHSLIPVVICVSIAALIYFILLHVSFSKYLLRHFPPESP